MPEELAELLHVEYLKELFGVFGDGAVLLAPQVFAKETRGEWGYVSEPLEQCRNDLWHEHIGTGGSLELLPRWKRVLDPCERAHWWLVTNDNPEIKKRYADFIASMEACKLSSEHGQLLRELELSDIKPPSTAVQIRDALSRSFASTAQLSFQKERSTRNAFVFGCGLSSQIDLVVSFEEVNKAFDKLRATMRVAVRLVASGAKLVVSPALEGFVFEVPQSSMVPGGHVYNRIRTEYDIVLALAYNVLLAELLVPPFKAAFAEH